MKSAYKYELADAAGVSRRTFQRWLREPQDFPAVAQGEPRAVVPFWCETHLSHAASEGSPLDMFAVWD